MLEIIENILCLLSNKYLIRPSERNKDIIRSKYAKAQMMRTQNDCHRKGIQSSLSMLYIGIY